MEDFTICKENWQVLSFDKYVVAEVNLGGLSLNTKKIQAALIKKAAITAMNLENEYDMKKAIQNLSDICRHVPSDIGYSVEIDEECDIGQIFKAFDLRIKNDQRYFVDKLMSYITIHIEFFKTKIFIFSLLSKYLTEYEIVEVFKFCQSQDVSLILFEDCIPKVLQNKSIPIKSLIIDDDFCEIPIN